MHKEDPFSNCRFKYNPRKIQREILDVALKSKKDESRLYFVSPPGSGKTIAGLMLAVEMNVKTVVLAPNTAIQAQWIDKFRGFTDGNVNDFATVDPFDSKPLTVLTYQTLARTDSLSESEREKIIEEWVNELLLERGFGDGNTEKSSNNPELEEAIKDIREWLDKYEKQNPDRFDASLMRRWKTRRKSRESGDRIVNAESIAIMESLKRQNTGLVILDECHHLLGYWAQVCLKFIEILGYPRVAGFTATHPAPDELTAQELDYYKGLFHDVDYIMPTPAVVKDGFLAPYQDLVYFTRPKADELVYIQQCSEKLSEALLMLESQKLKTKLSDWLLAECARVAKKSGTSELRRRTRFFNAAVRYLKAWDITPPGILANIAEGTPSLEEKTDIAGRFAASILLVSGNSGDREMFEQLRVALRPLGFILTEKGVRKGESTVSRVLSLSNAKTTGMTEILRKEQESGADIRAIVITDFEKSSATVAKDISDLITEESGGAIAAMRALTSDEKCDELDPILVTGQTVLVDDDLLDKFTSTAFEWVAERDLSIEMEAVPEEGFFRILGHGRDWNPRHYVAMITEMFEKGVTRCLVGTRGLLGEGWDSLCANTLVDLTTAATEMTVNQLRGRAIRLNPAAPAKVANIWDVVCFAPEFEKGLSDYMRFARKHSRYYGICDDGAIEYGLGHIHPALTEAGPEDVALNAHIFNDEMLARAAGRKRIRVSWKIGEPYENTQVSSLELKLEKIMFANNAVRTDGVKIKGLELSADRQLFNICNAVLLTMKELNLLAKKKASLNVTARNNGYYRIFLDNAASEDMEKFMQAVNALFEPLTDQRYIIPRYEEVVKDNWLSKMFPEVVGKYLRTRKKRIAVYHPLPRCFGDSKSHAELFSDNWNKYVSPGRAIFAKRGKGEEVLSKAKQKKQSVKNARAKIKSLWK